MFKVFTEQNIFEEIILFKEKTPHWYSILSNHATVFLNISDEQLKEEEKEGTIIFEFIKSAGGKIPIALNYEFDNIREYPEKLAENPRSAFFLDLSDDDCSALSQQYGVIVQNINLINDQILKSTYYKELESGQKLPKGWMDLMMIELPPINALLIADNFLFKNEDHGLNLGVENIIKFLNDILPYKLLVDFHILILGEDGDRSVEKCSLLVSDLTTRIKALRSYSIIVEIVFTNTIHKRKIFGNYYSITCDKGFDVFRASDGITVRMNNDFRIETLFTRVAGIEGDSVFDSDKVLLSSINRNCETVFAFLQNQDQVSNRRLLGDCNKNQPIRNRLLLSLE